jgi:hypothetical protein
VRGENEGRASMVAGAADQAAGIGPIVRRLRAALHRIRPFLEGSRVISLPSDLPAAGGRPFLRSGSRWHEGELAPHAKGPATRIASPSQDYWGWPYGLSCARISPSLLAALCTFT